MDGLAAELLKLSLKTIYNEIKDEIDERTPGEMMASRRTTVLGEARIRAAPAFAAAMSPSSDGGQARGEKRRDLDLGVPQPPRDSPALSARYLILGG